MAGVTNYPTGLDDSTSLLEVTDGVSEILDEHHNNTMRAVIAIEQKLGVYNSGVPTSLDYRVGHPSLGHSHNGASGQGPQLSASTLLALIPRHIVSIQQVGSIGVGSKITAPVILGRTMQLESVQVGLRRGPSGATTGLIVRFGASHIFGASVGFGPRFSPGATAYLSTATPNVVTYPSGAVITLDAEAVGSNDPGQDAGITFIFRE